MILYESFIYGFKTLLYGVPISIFIEWILYKQINTLNVLVKTEDGMIQKN